MKRREFGGQTFWKRLRSKVARLLLQEMQEMQLICLLGKCVNSSSIVRAWSNLAGHRRRAAERKVQKLEWRKLWQKQLDCKAQKHRSEKREANLQRKTSFSLSGDTVFVPFQSCEGAPITAMSQHVCRNIWVKRNQHVGGKTCTDCPWSHHPCFHQRSHQELFSSPSSGRVCWV